MKKNLLIDFQAGAWPSFTDAQEHPMTWWIINPLVTPIIIIRYFWCIGLAFLPRRQG